VTVIIKKAITKLAQVSSFEKDANPVRDRRRKVSSGLGFCSEADKFVETISDMVQKVKALGPLKREIAA